MTMWIMYDDAGARTVTITDENARAPNREIVGVALEDSVDDGAVTVAIGAARGFAGTAGFAHVSVGYVTTDADDEVTQVTRPPRPVDDGCNATCRCGARAYHSPLAFECSRRCERPGEQ